MRIIFNSHCNQYNGYITINPQWVFTIPNSWFCTLIVGFMKTNEKIRVLREERNWSQEEMANKLQMSTNGYAKLERGESRLYIPKLEQIADVFDIDILELMSVGEKNLVLFQESGNNHCINIIGNTEKELALEISQLKLNLAHKEEVIQYKNEIIELQKRELETLRNILSKK